MTSDVPYPWGLYQELQSRLDSCGRVTGAVWGMEYGLDRLLATAEGGDVPAADLQQEITKAVASAHWTERNRARLRRKYYAPADGIQPSIEAQVLAQIKLREIQDGVAAADWKVLLAVAFGFTYEQIAAGPRTTTVSAVRTRVSRLRARLRG